MKKSTMIIMAILIAIVSSLTTLAFEKTKGTPFPDIDYDAYYTDAVVGLSFAGIITGYEDGNFGPSDPVTRAQVATILHRYDKKLVGTPVVSSGLGVADLTHLICEGFDENDFENDAYNSRQVYIDICNSRFQ